MNKVVGRQNDHLGQYEFNITYRYAWGTRWRCDTIGKVLGSIPDGVIAIYHWHNPSGRNMSPESTQLLTEMSTRSISLE
jgi:hypothetical protein